MSTLEISNPARQLRRTNGQGTLALSGVNLSMKPGDFVVALGAWLRQDHAVVLPCRLHAALRRADSAGRQPVLAPAPNAAWCFRSTR